MANAAAAAPAATNQVKSILQTVVSIASLLLMVIVLSATGPVLIGWNTFIVTSGSMEPEIHTGSSVVTDKVHNSLLKVNDVITFIDRSNGVITHRIIEIVNDGQGVGFKTKGDANKSEDIEIVRPVNILGKVLYSVPFAGYIINYTNTMQVRLGILVVAIIIAGTQMQWWAFNKKSEPAPAAPAAAAAAPVAPAGPAAAPVEQPAPNPADPPAPGGAGAA